MTEVSRPFTGETCARTVIGLDVVLRTGVKPVRRFLRIRFEVASRLRSGSKAPSAVNPCTGADSSPSSGGGLFIPIEETVGIGPERKGWRNCFGSGVLALN